MDFRNSKFDLKADLDKWISYSMVIVLERPKSKQNQTSRIKFLVRPRPFVCSMQSILQNLQFLVQITFLVFWPKFSTEQDLKISPSKILQQLQSVPSSFKQFKKQL